MVNEKYNYAENINLEKIKTHLRNKKGKKI